MNYQKPPLKPTQTILYHSVGLFKKKVIKLNDMVRFSFFLEWNRTTIQPRTDLLMQNSSKTSTINKNITDYDEFDF
jgi:hypothetical protein